MEYDTSFLTKLTGYTLNMNDFSEFFIDQKHYLKKLESIPPNATFLMFRSVRKKLSWLANFRPNRLLGIAQLAQVPEAQW